MRISTCALAALLVLAATALAGTDVLVRNGDVVTGAFGAAGEVDTLRIDVPEGASVTAKAVGPKGGPALRVRLTAPAGGVLAEASGAKPSIKKAAIAATGRHVLTVGAADGASAGSYTLTITWKSRTSAGVTLTVGAGGSGAFPFAADANTKATFAVKKGKRSGAVPTLVSYTPPGRLPQPIEPATKATATLPRFGAYTLTFENTGADGGAIVASAKLVAPKPVKRALDVTALDTPAGVVIAEFGPIGPEGGTLRSDALGGAAVTIPAGALAQTTTILLGTEPDIAYPADPLLVPAGPAIFFGPDTQQFAVDSAVTLTVPFDGANFAESFDGMTVLVRTPGGPVLPVTNPPIGPGDTVSLSSIHFSGYQVNKKTKDATVVARIFDTGSVAEDRLGTAVAATADWIVLTRGVAPGNDETRTGSVFVHPFDNATGVVGAPQVLTNPDTSDDPGFGTAVAISDDWLVVTRSRPQTDLVPRGRAILYHRVGGVWQYAETKTQRVTDDNVEFGHSVAINGDRMVVGSPWVQSNGTSASAAAYVFHYDGQTWAEEARLVSSQSADANSFGSAVAIHDTTVAVGCEDFTGFQPGTNGSVVVFARNAGNGQWSQTDRFTSNGTEKLYGHAVALSSNVLVVGAPDFFGSTEGRAAVYAGQAGSMSFVETLTGEGPLNATFGTSCDLRGDLLVIGAPGQLQQHPGKAYGYRRTGGTFRRTGTLRGQDIPLNAAAVGFAVSWAGQHFVAGAPTAKGGTNSDTTNGGAAFVVLPE